MLELPVEAAQAREVASRHFRGRLKQVRVVGVCVCRCVGVCVCPLCRSPATRRVSCDDHGAAPLIHSLAQASYLLHRGSGPAMGMHKDDEVGA